jgi:hypothetical protein
MDVRIHFLARNIRADQHCIDEVKDYKIYFYLAYDRMKRLQRYADSWVECGLNAKVEMEMKH